MSLTTYHQCKTCAGRGEFFQEKQPALGSVTYVTSSGFKCPHCQGTGFNLSYQAQHERMKPMLALAQKYDIAKNALPVAIFNPGNSGLQVYAVPWDKPTGQLWEKVTPHMIAGAFTKPCALVGGVTWSWTDPAPGEGKVWIQAMTIESYPYILTDHSNMTGLAERQIFNMSIELEWLEQKIVWLWQETEVTWPMPDIAHMQKELKPI